MGVILEVEKSAVSKLKLLEADWQNVMRVVVVKGANLQC